MGGVLVFNNTLVGGEPLNSELRNSLSRN